MPPFRQYLDSGARSFRFMIGDTQDILGSVKDSIEYYYLPSIDVRRRLLANMSRWSSTHVSYRCIYRIVVHDALEIYKTMV